MSVKRIDSSMTATAVPPSVRPRGVTLSLEALPRLEAGGKEGGKVGWADG